MSALDHKIIRVFGGLPEIKLWGPWGLFPQYVWCIPPKHSEKNQKSSPPGVRI